MCVRERERFVAGCTEICFGPLFVFTRRKEQFLYEEEAEDHFTPVAEWIKALPVVWLSLVVCL